MGYFKMWHTIEYIFKFHYTQDTNKIQYYVKEDMTTGHWKTIAVESQ
jgi:hypothetical protein